MVTLVAMFCNLIVRHSVVATHPIEDKIPMRPPSSPDHSSETDILNTISMYEELIHDVAERENILLTRLEVCRDPQNYQHDSYEERLPVVRKCHSRYRIFVDRYSHAQIVDDPQLLRVLSTLMIQRQRLKELYEKMLRRRF